MGKYIFLAGLALSFASAGIFALVSHEIEQNSVKKSVPITSTAPVEQSNEPEKEEASVTLYIDFNCPYCKNFYQNTFTTLRKKYKTQIPFEVQLFPLQTQGISMEVSKFYECANQQTNQWELLDYLLVSLEKFDLSEEKKWIEELQLNTEDMKICKDSKDTKNQIIQQKEEGKEKTVRGTPTVLIGGKKFEGNTDQSTLEIEILKNIAL